MRILRYSPLVLAGLLLASPAPAADDTPAKGKIVAVDLFKNGLAVVTCEAALGKAGSYTLEDVPHPVHGTFWIDGGGAAVDAAVKMRDVEVPITEAGVGSLQDDLAGKKVTLHVKGANRPPVTGTMVKFKAAKEGESVTPSRFLVVQTAKGRVYVEASEVTSVESEDAGDKVTRRRPQLVLSLGATDKAETKVTLRYLTHGMTWAPSYRIDITDPKTLTLEQHAVVKNELTDLDGAEVRLISGFPSVQFAHVRSPMTPGITLPVYFSELANRMYRDVDVLSNNVVSQQASFNYRSPSAPALGAIPTGEGVDLHYQPIGKRTLAKDDSLALMVAKGKADYERIVEWLVPDNRDEYGRYDGRGRDYDGRPRSEDDDAWDALKFKNPLSFPMTTAPAMVTAKGQFNGQRTSYWTNAGEETILRVERALSVRTRAAENEQLGKNGADTRDFVWIGGRQFRKSTVEGELAVSNHRKETIQMVVRRRFSGELVKADENPTVTLREEGVYSVNKRNEMVWNLSLKGGEEKRLKYSYTVLVAH